MSSIDNQKLGNLFNVISKDKERQVTENEMMEDLEKVNTWSSFEAVATLYKWDKTKPSKTESMKEREEGKHQEKTESEFNEPAENWTRIHYKTGKKH